MLDENDKLRNNLEQKTKEFNQTESELLTDLQSFRRKTIKNTKTVNSIEKFAKNDAGNLDNVIKMLDEYEKLKIENNMLELKIKKMQNQLKDEKSFWKKELENLENKHENLKENFGEIANQKDFFKSKYDKLINEIRDSGSKEEIDKKKEKSKFIKFFTCN